VRQGVSYKLDVDLAGVNSPSLRDVFVGLEDVPFLQNVNVGQFRAPFQLDAMTSSNSFTFAERAPQFVFAPFRQLGVGAFGASPSEQATWACSAFRYPTDGQAIAQADGGYGFAGRTTALLVDNDEHGLLHVGGGYGMINPGGNVIQYEVRSTFFLAETPGGPSEVPPLLDTGPIPTDNLSLFDAELAGTLGPIHLQSELSYSMVDQISGPVLTFYGAYAQIGWLITGESRSYDRQAGVFQAIEPRQDFSLGGGLGAWEIASRWSYINLNDGTINGGQLNSIECALNWHWSRRLKMKLLYSRVAVENTPDGDATLDIYGSRVQVVF
jgi:phosphate-selective porin OprO/OprP